MAQQPCLLATVPVLAEFIPARVGAGPREVGLWAKPEGVLPKPLGLRFPSQQWSVGGQSDATTAERHTWPSLREGGPH